MTAVILDGREVAQAMRAEIDQAVAEFTELHGFAPAIAVVRAGEDAASVSYANAIRRMAEKRGIAFDLLVLPETASQESIVELVRQLSNDTHVHGIMVQEPLPRGIDEAAVKEALAPEKDVDGVHAVNAGRLMQVSPAGRPAGVKDFFAPATPSGGLEILKRYNVELGGKHAVIVGRSNIVGKPMAMLLLRENATVTLAHSRTANLAEVCRSADILCAAVGRAKIITADMVRPGAVVVDFGINFDSEGNMLGDVDFEAVKEVAGMITPVPGGTGPMTNIVLMHNVLEAARRQVGR
ncbi:MAG: bifunctional 5,10-methylenetetrahydrofolate dehydrogenase/5,10-methenyltetrahydrofolate cyclohydrolase [Chloroflexota bacterium]